MQLRGLHFGHVTEATPKALSTPKIEIMNNLRFVRLVRLETLSDAKLV